MATTGEPSLVACCSRHCNISTGLLVDGVVALSNTYVRSMNFIPLLVVLFLAARGECFRHETRRSGTAFAVVAVRHRPAAMGDHHHQHLSSSIRRCSAWRSLGIRASTFSEGASPSPPPTSEDKKLTGDINSAVAELCRGKSFEKAARVLLEYADDGSTAGVNAESYHMVMQSIAAKCDDAASANKAATLLEKLLEKAKHVSKSDNGFATTCRMYNSVILAWSKSFEGKAGPRCVELLQDLWSRYNQTRNSQCLPMKSTYVLTLTALARSAKRTRETAQQAESLLEEMERLREEHAFLAPTTVCVNVVL